MKSIIVQHLCVLFIFHSFQSDCKPVSENADSTKVVIQDVCWSADDNFIYFSAMKVNFDYSNYSPDLWTIYRYDLLTKKIDTIYKSAIYISVAPNGEQIAISVNENDKRNIYITEPDGTDANLVADMGTKSFAPSWSPDGNALVFNSDLTGTIELYTWKRESGKIERITESGEHKSYNPSWSPDGKKIVYYYEKGDGKDQIHLINSDGSNDTNLTDDNFHNIFPGWIDSNTIVYGQISEDQKVRLFSIDLNGRNKNQIFQIESFYGRYSKNRKKIAYIGSQQSEIIITDNNANVIDKISLIKGDQ